MATPGLAQERSLEPSLAPSLTTLRRETRELLINEASLSDGAAKDAAIAALCDMYVVLRKDSRYRESEMLQQDAGKIRHRLNTTASRRKSRLRRANVPRPTHLNEALEQTLASVKNDPEMKLETLNDHVAEVQAIHGQLAGGQQAGGQQAGRRAGGGAPDNGWQLVELIQRIVAPEFWDAQGGPGTMHYFAMRRLLVVRATSDVHQQVRDLLMALPR